MKMSPLRVLERPTQVVRQDHLQLGMMQLSCFGLSEQWVLRDCGDRHWQLIADALGQSGTLFHDTAGHQVYAAFCATRVELAASSVSLLGRQMTVASHLFRVSSSRLGSVHRLSIDGHPVGQVQMVGRFLRHGATRSNRDLARSQVPNLPELPQAPADLAALDRRARSVSRRTAAKPSQLAFTYATVEALDFNAVGLLYFPTYSKISAMAERSTCPVSTREVVYLANLNPGETVTVHRQGASSTLYDRRQDMIAQVRTSWHTRMQSGEPLLVLAAHEVTG